MFAMWEAFAQGNVNTTAATKTDPPVEKLHPFCRKEWVDPFTKKWMRCKMHAHTGCHVGVEINGS